jgi:hypothetical protein
MLLSHFFSFVFTLPFALFDLFVTSRAPFICEPLIMPEDPRCISYDDQRAAHLARRAGTRRSRALSPSARQRGTGSRSTPASRREYDWGGHFAEGMLRGGCTLHAPLPTTVTLSIMQIKTQYNVYYEVAIS